MKAVIIDMETYESLPSAICGAIWETFEKSYGAKLISRESGGVIDPITMTGMLHGVIKAVLEEKTEQ